jgi:hypothetical protein
MATIGRWVRRGTALGCVTTLFTVACSAGPGVDAPPEHVATAGAMLSATDCGSEARQLASTCVDPINAVGTALCTDCAGGIVEIATSGGALTWQVAGACLMCQLMTFPCKATLNQFLNDCSHPFPAPPWDPCLSLQKTQLANGDFYENPITHKSFGFYCGGTHTDGFDAHDSSQRGNLYECEGGLTKTSLIEETSCPAGTVCGPADARHQQVGQLYDCIPAPPPPPDRCAKVPSSANGMYCGSSRQSGFAGGDSKTIYDCVNGKTAGTTYCAFGCFVAPPGAPDGCNSADPCANVPAADNGAYCAGSTQFGFDPTKADDDTLYDCQNGHTASKTFCTSGCQIAPPGQADACFAGSSPNPCGGVPAADSGLYCGTSRQFGFAGGDSNTVYDCQGSKVASTIPCAFGCFIAPPGAPDGCDSADPCANVPAADNGLYCSGSSQFGFDPGKADDDTLYDCIGGRTASKTFCTNGCRIAPAGQADSCF